MALERSFRMGMEMMLTFAFLILFLQLLTSVSSATVDCNQNSVIVEDQTTTYQRVNLLVGNSCCKHILERDTEAAMKSMCAGMNDTEAAANERNRALNTKIDAMERKIDNLILAILDTISRCPSGYNYYEPDHFCYKFNNVCKSWSEARQACQQDGGDLLILKAGNFDYFRNLAISKIGVCNSVWLGSTDAYAEGQWNWLNGERVSASLWYPGEPSNGANIENCAALTRFADYRLNDLDCNYKAYYLCQIV